MAIKPAKICKPDQTTPEEITQTRRWLSVFLGFTTLALSPDKVLDPLIKQAGFLGGLRLW